MKTSCIRKANLDDLEQIAELEQLCFPESEAATKEILRNRLDKYSECFFVLTLSGKIVKIGRAHV